MAKPDKSAAGEESENNKQQPQNIEESTGGDGSSSVAENDTSRPAITSGTDVGGSSATPQRLQQVAVGDAGAVKKQQVEGDINPAISGSAAASASAPRKKRTRTEDPGAGSSSTLTKPKFDAPELATPCSVCGKQFASWKALFGHMRSHPDRQWRGVHPPPKFNRDGSPENTEQAQEQNVAKQQAEELASTLLNLAQELEKSKSTTTHASAADGSGPSGSNTVPSSSRVLDIDLNVAQEPSPSSSAEPVQMDGSGIDLNVPAPQDSDDEAAA